MEIIEKKRQGVFSKIICFRDIEKDKYVKRMFENHNFIAIVIVIGIYYE